MPDGQASTGNTEIVITDNAAARIAKLIEKEGNESLKLRIAISGGGCSGFVYGFELDEAISDDDLVFEHNGIKVLVDETSIKPNIPIVVFTITLPVSVIPCSISNCKKLLTAVIKSAILL